MAKRYYHVSCVLVVDEDSAEQGMTVGPAGIIEQLDQSFGSDIYGVSVRVRDVRELPGDSALVRALDTGFYSTKGHTRG